MEPQRDRVRAVFDRAAEIGSKAEREEYLVSACVDAPEVRREVEDLLRAYERAGSFLGLPTGEGLTTQPPEDSESAADTSPSHSDLGPPEGHGSLGRLGHYDVREVLGRGGFGVVYRAFDGKLHRMVAIKVLGPRLSESEVARRRFLREARSAAGVQNQHVVAVHAVEEVPVPYLVMEYVAGQTLQQKIDPAGPLSPTDVVRVGAQMAEGLAAAHRLGLVHRDIKPGNILLENGVERVKIADFGLARAAADERITESGVVAGTPHYMSPEQARGEPVDPRSDLFSLGSVLYAMCTGHPPFRGDTVLGVLHRVCEAIPQPVREVNPEVPGWLADIVARLHAKAPERRYGSAQEVSDLLARGLASLPANSSETLARSAPTPAPRQSLPRWVWVAGLIFALGVALGVWAWPTRPAGEGSLVLGEREPPRTVRPSRPPPWRPHSTPTGRRSIRRRGPPTSARRSR